MSYKAPGIYFQEIDNTQYENPKTISGTTACVIGFAKKGPIGVPVAISDYKTFTDTFGKAVEGKYSDFAVRNILSAGGGIIFVRVADNNASRSSVIMKNTVKGSNGKVIFKRSSDIKEEEESYVNRSVYAVKVLNAKNESKNVFVRTPATGKLTQSSIMDQLKKGIESNNKSTYELRSSDNATINPGLYSFEIDQGENEDDLLEENKGFYVNLTDAINMQKLSIIMEDAINEGPNKLATLKLTADSTGAETTIIDDTIVIRENSDITENFYFNVKQGDTSYPISIRVDKGSISIADLLIQISEVFQSKGIKAYAIYKNDTNELIFVNDITNNEDIKILSKTDEAGNKRLFAAAGTLRNEDIDPPKNDEEGIKLFINDYKLRNIRTPRTGIEISYDKDMDSILFSSEKDTIKVIPNTNGGNYLFDFINGCGLVKSEDDVYEYAKQEALEGIKIYREEDSRRIALETCAPIETLTEYPNLESLGETSNFKDLLELMKDPKDPLANPIETIFGKKEDDGSLNDKVAIFAKELGSGTDNIAVEFYTSKSPIDETVVKNDITVYVNGEAREKFEDVSYDTTSDKFFEKVMEESEDNGGSKYVFFDIEKKELGTDVVSIKQGIYTIGKPLNKDSILKTDSMTSYSSYDYSIGDDGIPEDDDESNELFINAMDPINAPIADENLYNFHILIHPDNINSEVQDAAIKLCEERKDSFTIVDPPIGYSADRVIDWHNGKDDKRLIPLETNYAATYWPWCKAFDISTRRYIWIMPSVVMAAKYVTVDRTVGSWYAPAGENNGRMSVVDIERYPNRLERSKLYLDYNRVNPFMKLQDGTILCYGEKTLQRNNSILTKIHARRMMIQIKKEIREALRGYIFMPNTAEYLPKITSKVTAILEKYKVGGGLASYKVVCDETNNSIITRQQDIINIAVSIVPEGVIEQIDVVFNINKTDETVTNN